jgi:uncharacterized protein YkwD
MLKNLSNTGAKYLQEIIGTFFFLCYLFEVAEAQSSYYSLSPDDFRTISAFNDTIDLENVDLVRINAILFYLTNETRKANGLNTLNYNPYLEECATLHSDNMIEKDFFDHINKRSRAYRTPEDRARSVGIQNPMLAENIIQAFLLRYTANKPVIPEGNYRFRYPDKSEPIKAHTYLSLGEKMMEEWMNSSGHRSNILHAKAVELGCGTAFYKDKDNGMPMIMATQNFQLYYPVQVTK